MNIRAFLLLILVTAFSLSFAAAADQNASSPPELENYYFVLLTRGPKWTAERTPEVEKLQAAHIANINRMHDAGKLVVAGPFTDNSKWSGLYIFKSTSVEETKSLVESDPAIVAGRLAYEIHPWATKKGMLPQ